MAKFFRFQFGVDGDKTAIPEVTQVSGAVSYQQGWGFDYERPQDGSDPLAKDIPRDESNQLYYDITDAIRQYQTHGIPDFITTSDNGGSPYSYTKYARVLYDDGGGIQPFTSLVDSNIALPSDNTKWSKGDSGITNLIGDVVADGPGIATATIQPNAVTTIKINAKAVTFAKIQDIPAYSAVVNSTASPGAMGTVALAIKQLLGRGDATTGAFGAIAVGTGLDILGNTLVNTRPAVDSRQLLKAWVKFDTNGAILSSYNVSSVTHGGLGNYTLNFTTPMVDVNYVISSQSQFGGFSGNFANFYMLEYRDGDTNTVNALQLRGLLMAISNNSSTANSVGDADVLGFVAIYGN